MTTVNFKYILDEKVITSFKEDGIIKMMAYDDGGKNYYVQTAASSGWYKEKELSSKN